MRLDSFIELVVNLSLAQIRVDLYEDEAEGGYYANHIVPKITNGALKARLKAEYGYTSGESTYDDYIRRLRRTSFVTCWYEGSVESHGMWKVYGRQSESVAIETTVGRLRQLLVQNGYGAALVERIKYEPMPAEITRIEDYLLHKLPEYKYELEVRTIMLNGRFNDQQKLVLPLDFSPAVMPNFVETIIVAPGTRDSLFKAIVDLVRDYWNRHNLPRIPNINRSSLENYRIPHLPYQVP